MFFPLSSPRFRQRSAGMTVTDRRTRFEIWPAMSDDLSREVYCILGLPIDAIEMPVVLRSIEAAASKRARFLISTPNLNWLVNSQADPEFRESVLLSDLCPTDGMPIVWIARLIGIPIQKRIPGSDIFEALKAWPRSGPPLKIVLFGATEPVAAAASKRLNYDTVRLNCVGWVCPGFGSVDELSRDQFIDQINSSNADFLVAALGAKKGQLWLLRNHDRLQIPVRAHLGATVNFQAGTVRRAPYAVQKLGLEWLWRIKEEPYLWRRYWNDGRVLVRLLLTRVLPLIIWTRWLQLKYGRHEQELVIRQILGDETVTVSLSGPATARHLDKVISAFKDAIATKKRIIIDFSNTRMIDARFLGLLLMLRKKLKSNGASQSFIGLSSELERIFHLNHLGFLLSSDKGA
jgi:N-acetylglucosaminyldiphosphoundecaprenol N-acetyl-beta-D-mannosaminyltransferase